MSAIAGVVSFAGLTRDPTEIASMLDLMANRGPDQRQTWHGDVATLGCGVLHATSESRNEQQPVIDPPTGNVIVADVRLDNRSELLGSLGISGKTTGDATIIAAAYRRWGERCVDHLRGDFAFAVWDATRHELFLARDHFGVRPLTYHQGDGFFAFASDSRAIVSLENVPVTPERSRLIDLLVGSIEAVDTTNTFFQGVFRLAPATTMTISATGVRTAQYWRLEEPEPLRLASSGDYQEALRDVLGQAVASRLRGSDDVGVMLSGGIDSGAIAAETAQRQTVRSFSGTTSERDCIESRLIKATAERTKAIASFVQPDEVLDLLGPIERSRTGVENPFETGALLSSVFCTARKQGVRSILSGVLADEVVAVGPGDHLALLLTRRDLSGFVKAGLHNGNQRALYGVSGMARIMAGTILRSAGLRRSRDGRQRAIAVASERIAGLHLQITDQEAADLIDRFEMYYRRPVERTGASTRVALFQRNYATAALERYDRFGADCGVEVRSPYMDLRVVQFMLSVPAAQLTASGYSKALQRHAYAEHLPNDVVWSHSKGHLGWQFTDAWLGADQTTVLDRIPHDSRLDGFVDLTAIRRDAGTPLAANSALAFYLAHLWLNECQPGS